MFGTDASYSGYRSTEVQTATHRTPKAGTTSPFDRRFIATPEEVNESEEKYYNILSSSGGGKTFSSERTSRVILIMKTNRRLTAFHNDAFTDNYKIQYE